MSLRALFLLLLFANLAFLGWADLIDVPPEPPPSDGISHLPQLKLLSEVRGPAAAPDHSATGSSSSSAAAVSPTGASSATGASGAASSADAADPPGSPAPLGSAAPTSAARADPVSGPGAVGVSHRCVAVGPFADPERAREAMDLLRQRGFSPQPRTAPSGPPRGYWVFIGGLKSPADETRVVQRLERNGIADAKAMPASNGTRRVSVGLFSARDGAERRARAVRRLGLDAEIAPRQAATTHWVDVDLDSSRQSLPAEGLLSLKEGGSQLEIEGCPSAKDGGSRSLGQGTAGSKGAPAAPRPPAKTPDFNPQIPSPLTAEGRPRPG